MRRIPLFLLAALIVLAWSSPSMAQGKDVFTKNKCNACHNIASQGIEKASAAATEEKGEEAAAATEKKVEPPDLSTVGAKRDSAWIQSFLKKETDIDGRKHKKKWTGTPEELKTLADWLAGLKEAKK